MRIYIRHADKEFANGQVQNHQAQNHQVQNHHIQNHQDQVHAQKHQDQKEHKSTSPKRAPADSVSTEVLTAQPDNTHVASEHYRYDPGITEEGRIKCRHMAKRLIKTYGIPVFIICSPYRRTRETAEEMARVVDEYYSVPVKIDTRLSEYLGHHPQQPLDVSPDTLAYSPPHPEKFFDMQHRVFCHNDSMKLLDYLTDDAGQAVPVWFITHGIILSRIAHSMGHYLKRPPYLGSIAFTTRCDVPLNTSSSVPLNVPTTALTPPQHTPSTCAHVTTFTTEAANSIQTLYGPCHNGPCYNGPSSIAAVTTTTIMADGNVKTFCRQRYLSAIRCGVHTTRTTAITHACADVVANPLVNSLSSSPPHSYYTHTKNTDGAADTSSTPTPTPTLTPTLTPTPTPTPTQALLSTPPGLSTAPHTSAADVFLATGIINTHRRR